MPLAIEGGPPVRSTRFPLEEPPPPAEDDDPIAALERELASYLDGERVAVACASHAEALSLAIRAAGLEEGEVVVPSLHAEPAARALLATALRPVPAEVDHETANLAPSGLAQAVGPQTRAVVVTHAFGHPAPMPELLRLAEHHDLAVIEDISGALGASHGDRRVGNIGHVAALGFGPTHLLTGGGEGGVVIVPDEAAADRVRGWRAEIDAGPSEGTMRVALAELRRAEEQLQIRRETAWHLTYELRGLRPLAPMSHGRWIRHGYDGYVCRIRPVLWRRPVAETVAALRAEGIPCALAAGPPLHEDDEVRAALGADDPRIAGDRLAAASSLPHELLAIPLSAAATTRDMNDVAEALRKVALASTHEPRPR